MGIGIEEFVSGESLSESLRCPICRDVFDEPVFCAGRPCQCVFCRRCLTQHLQRGDARCPVDRLPMQETDIVRHFFVRGLVDELLVFCRHREAGCCWTGKLESRVHHEATCPTRKVQALKDEVVQLQTEAHDLETQVQCLNSQLQEKRKQMDVLASSAQERQNVICTLESKLSQQYRQVWEELWLAGDMKNGELAREGLRAGFEYCLLSSGWYAKWHSWISDFGACLGVCSNLALLEKVDRSRVGGSQPERVWPGAIDNSMLVELDDMTILRQDVCEGEDFVVVSLKAWKLLYTWYGGGPTLRRRAVNLLSGGVELELHGLRLQILTSSSLNSPFIIVESKTATVGDFKDRICDELGLEAEKVRIWDYFNRRKYEEITMFDSKTLEACHLFDGNPILVELEGENVTSTMLCPMARNTWHCSSQPLQSLGPSRSGYPYGRQERLPQRGITLAVAAVAGIA